MKNILSFFFLLSFYCLTAQTITINGKVLNKTDNQVIPYCAIGSMNTNKGTVCNENGEFVLNTDSNEILVISLIGFEKKTINIQSLPNKKDVIIYLEPTSYQLSEVSILAISPLEIIKNAINKIQTNYPLKPCILSGFYRETMEDNKKYTRLLEAAVNIYDPGFNPRKNKLNEITKLIAVRSSYNLSPIFKGLHYNGITELYHRNLVKYVGDFLNEKNFNNYVYQLDSVTVLNEEAVYVISFNPKKDIEKVLSEGKMFIRKKDFAILEINYGINKNAKYWTDSKFNDTLLWNTNHIQVNLKFTERNHLLYLNYVSKKYENVYYKQDKSKPEIISIAFSELMINNIQTENVQAFKKNDAMNTKNDLFVQKTNYDSLFWNNYNIIKATALQEKVKKDLEKQKTLEQQYLSEDPSKLKK